MYSHNNNILVTERDLACPEFAEMKVFFVASRNLCLKKKFTTSLRAINSDVLQTQGILFYYPMKKRSWPEKKTIVEQ